MIPRSKFVVIDKHTLHLPDSVFFLYGPDAECDEQKSNDCAGYCSADGCGGQRQQVC